MVSYGALPRPSAAVERAAAVVRRTRRGLARFARPRSFALPPDAESAALRFVRNAARFRLHYALLLWVLLLAVLAPGRRLALVLLMTTTKVAGAIGVLLRALPSSSLVHRLLTRRRAVTLFLLVVVAQLVFTGAMEHFVIAMAVGVPIVVMHGVMRVEDDHDVEDGGELDGDCDDKKKEHADLELAS